MTFRSFDVSDPVGGDPGLRHLTVGSLSLGRRADLTVYTPPGDTALPVVILLHGLYGSHWNWAVNGRAPATLAQSVAEGRTRPSTLVMPSDGLRGDGSGYLARPGEDAEAFIVDEVVEAARALDDRSSGPVFIAGLSMGGFGALRLAARHPGRFAAAAGMSSVTSLREMATFSEADVADVDLGDGSDGLAGLLTSCPPGIPLRLDCGVDDALLESNRSVHRALEGAAVAHEYSEHPGGHDWAYWRARLPEVLAFFGRVAI